MKTKVGDRFVCATSMSNFYTQGKTYEVVEKDGKLGFIGDDGLFDILGKTTSRFVPEKGEGVVRSGGSRNTQPVPV